MSYKAVIELSGQQFYVSEGDKLTVNQHLAGDTLKLDQILLIVNDDKAIVGTPYVKDASVELKIESLQKAPKIRVSRFRAKSRYRRTLGHRQPQTTLLVTKITHK